jgi:DNA repair photolyase
MTIQFQEYQVKKLVNISKHVDGGWFWNKYSAYPYVGCAYGCAFCYQRMRNYCGRRDPALFDSVIKIKTNAIPLLKKELGRLPVDVIALGDWQNLAEKRYRLSRSMLEIACEMGFPVFINERSELITEDLPLLLETHKKANVTVAFSFSYVDENLRKIFEPKSPSIQNRLNSMRCLADAGIRVGMALMPILPFVSDSEEQLHASVKAAAEHGACFVLAGGLTMADMQARICLEAAIRFNPDLEMKWRNLYRWSDEGQPTYGPPGEYTLRIYNLVNDICKKNHLQNQIPRYIHLGHHAMNKRIAEQLFITLRQKELQGANSNQLWVYRKAAWTVDELDVDISLIYHQLGLDGLQSIDGIGKGIARLIRNWLDDPALFQIA